MGGLSGLIGGLIGSSQDLPTIDIRGLLATIQNAGAYQKSIINALPKEIQDALAKYAASNKDAGDAYKAGVTNTGNDLLSKTAALYGPDSDAAHAEMNAAKTQIYSTVPGTQDAIKSALAATGGLSRGHAGTALAQPYLQAAQQYGQKASDIAATQTGKAQDATAAALKTVASMNDAMFTQLFGMSKQQAQQILTTGNDALKEQLSALINQSNTETGQTLSAQGVAANNAYQNAVTRNAQQAQIWNGVADIGLQGIQAGFGGMGDGMSGLPAGADVSSPSYLRNAAANAPF